MKNKIQYLALILIILLFCTACNQKQDEAQKKEPPKQTTYLELLGIGPEEVEEIRLIYQPTGVRPDIEEKGVACWNRDDEKLLEVLNLLQQVELTLQENRDWQTLKPHYILGNTQLVLQADGESYCLPVLDIFEKGMGKPHPISWAIWQEEAVYAVNVEKLWDEGMYMGLALYFDRLAKPFLAEHDAIQIEIPPYYGGGINAASWYFDCTFYQMFDKSEFIFRGRILQADEKFGYQVEVLESYKGEWEPGYYFWYNDGTGLDAVNKRYDALVNESDHALHLGPEYIFFMKEYYNADKFERQEGVELVHLTDRQCGVCEIIDGTVWPIFNAKPGTSWFKGQTVEEIAAMCE